ncbi:MAG: response regulator transcription factor [Clostridium sp.]
MRILVVEDEIELCNTIAEGLKMDGYAVDTSYDGNQAYELMDVENYDLVILDLNLPGMDGIEILEKIRKTNNNLKILILSARGNISDKVKGLDLGANDYLVKPFYFEELEARVRNLLRRQFTQANTVLKLGEIKLDTIKRTLIIKDEKIVVTKKELGILEYLLLNLNRVVSKEELIEHVWNIEVDNFSNAIRVHIATLRKKLKSALGYDVMKTKIGQGYYLESIEKDYA